MRAREFVSRNIRENKTLAINIPISITVPLDGINFKELTSQDNQPDEKNGDPDVDVMVPPLQQEIELDKADAGKNSEVIDQLTQDEEDEDDENLPLAYR